MSDLRKIVERIQMDYPDVKVELDESSPDGAVFAEFYRGPFKILAEWRRGFGVGLSAGTDFVFGEGPHEILRTTNEALQRIQELLSTGRSTKAPDELALDTLRVVRRMSQQELARRLHVTQATVSKIERQSDMYLSTLGRLVGALGGQLELRAKFPGSEVRIGNLGDIGMVDERGPLKDTRRTTRIRRSPRVIRHK